MEFFDSYTQSVLMFMGINIILAASLNLVNGYMGEFSCGHAGFMAIGAYTASLANLWLFSETGLSDSWILPLFPVVLFLGAAASAIVSLMIAIPSFRTRGDYLAVITLASNLIIKNALENMESVGGPRGLMGMKQVTDKMAAIVNLPWMLIWVGLGVGFTLWVIHRFIHSTYGRGVWAIHQDELAAEMMSINTNKLKVIVFMLSSALAGIAGGLYAHVVGYVNPGSFSILKSTECLIMVYLGGMGSLSGSIISAVLFTLLLELLRPLQIVKWVVLPLLLILLMRFRPEGILGKKSHA